MGALRLGLEPWGWMEKKKKKKEKEKEEEKISHMCECIGHRPLWGRWPKRGGRQLDGSLSLNSQLLVARLLVNQWVERALTGLSGYLKSEEKN